MNYTDSKYSDDTIILYGLVTHLQRSETLSAQEFNDAKQAISKFLSKFTKEEVIKLRDDVTSLAVDIHKGDEVVVVGISQKQRDPVEQAKHNRQQRDALLRAKASSLQTNMTKAELMVVLRGYYKPEQPQIGFYGRQVRPESPESCFFSFRGNVYAMRYAEDDVNHQGNELRLDFVSPQKVFEDNPKKAKEVVAATPSLM